MTETIDQLIQARFDRVANPIDDGDWSGVLARAGRATRTSPRRRATRRVALAAAVALGAAAVTAVALGVPQTVIDFFSSPSAPANIKNWFAAQNVGAPRGMNPGAIADQARKITTASFDVNHLDPVHPTVHTLYVAPKKGGGFCYLWTNAGAGCLPAESPGSAAAKTLGPLGLDWYANDYAIFVDGWVRTGATKTVEARFADGTTATIPVTWVSAPVNAGFIAYPVPRAHRTRSDALSSVVALDANGNVVGKQEFRLTKPLDEDVLQTLPDGTQFSLPRRADAAHARKIISFRSTTGNEVFFWLMPRSGGGECYLFNRGEGCLPTNALADVPGAFNGGLLGGAPVLFFAQTKPGVTAVELRYQNGDTERLTPVEGFVLSEITPAHYERGTRLVAAVALDGRGKAIYTEHEETDAYGVYPCQKPADLGHGVKACP